MRTRVEPTEFRVIFPTTETYYRGHHTEYLMRISKVSHTALYIYIYVNISVARKMLGNI